MVKPPPPLIDPVIARLLGSEWVVHPRPCRRQPTAEACLPGSASGRFQERERVVGVLTGSVSLLAVLACSPGSGCCACGLRRKRIHSCRGCRTTPSLPIALIPSAELRCGDKTRQDEENTAMVGKGTAAGKSRKSRTCRSGGAHADGRPRGRAAVLVGCGGRLGAVRFHLHHLHASAALQLHSAARSRPPLAPPSRLHQRPAAGQSLGEGQKPASTPASLRSF